MVTRAVVSAGVPATKEPVGLLRRDGKRPDGMTQIPWRGKAASLGRHSREHPGRVLRCRRSSRTRWGRWTSCCQEVRKVRRNLHHTHISSNRRVDAWPDEWVCIPVFWWPRQKNRWHLRWQPWIMFYLPAAVGHHPTLQCSSLLRNICFAQRFGPLAIPHLFLDFFVFNPWDLYYQGY